MIKKIITYLGLVLLLVGCNQTQNNNTDKLKVTVTTPFLEDIVENVSGDIFSVDTIIPAGTDPHLYEAKSDDLSKLQNASLVLYHGLHFEGKMNSVLEKKGKSVTENFTSSDLDQMEEDGEKVVDPHFWFDISLYKKASENVAKELVKLSPENKKNIENKLKEYLVKLDKLDEENKSKLKSIPENSRYLVTPHDAFNYFARFYNFKVIAPQGVSTDSEVSNADIENTANLIVEHKIKAIFTETTTNPDRIEKLKQVVNSKNWDVKVVHGEDESLFSDSLAPKGKKGDNYIDMYRHNIDLIVSNIK